MSVDDEVMLCEVLGAMGGEAKCVTPVLRELQSRTKFDEIRSAAVKALESIAEPRIARDCGGMT
jgi:hypothetical protein